MARYKVLLSGDIYDQEKNRYIPADPQNGLYKIYLKWLDVPNTPDYETVDIDKLKEAKCREIDFYLINTKYNENMLYDVSTDTYGIGDSWQVDALSQNQLYARTIYAIQSERDAVNFPWSGDMREWRNNETPNVNIEFTTTAKFLLFVKSVNEHCNGLWQSAVTHKEAVRVLTTETEINNYDITIGW